MIVVDASVAVLGLLNEGEARRTLGDADIAAPHLIDTEIVHALRRLVRQKSVSVRTAGGALGRWGQLGVHRFAAVGLVDRVWQLRNNLTAYDATYVALAEVLDAPLHTADRRLAKAPGVRCEVVVLR